MSLSDAVALLSLRALPAAIQSRILTNLDFQREVGINGTTAPFNDAGRIRLGDLLDAAREVYATNEAHTVRNLEGNEVRLELCENHVLIASLGSNVEGNKARRIEFDFLSPKLEARREALSAIVDLFGVTGPRLSDWLDIVEHRPLSNVEVSSIHDAISRSVEYWWSNTQVKIDLGKMQPNDLVPQNVEYFTALCGPLPNAMNVNEYVSGPLARHRRMLLTENFHEGLSLSLAGSLREDAGIAHQLETFSDEEVWESANQLTRMPDPFTVLGLIEVSIRRRKSGNGFEALAANLIEKLCGESLPRHDGMDVFAIFPALVGATHRCLRRIDGMMEQPAYWHWLCAFTHAGVVTRLLDNLEFDPNQMAEWLDGMRKPSDGLADILALRHEPTWRFDLLSRNRLQAEIIGRLKGMAQKEEAQERSFPNSDLLDKRVDEWRSRGFSPFRPGPLEGYLRPKDRMEQTALSDDEVDRVLTQLSEAPSEFPWAGLDNLSAITLLPDKIRRAISEALPTIGLPQGTFLERTNALATAALIAATHLDRVMADAIFERLLQEFEGENDTQTAFLVTLIASAAVDGEAWNDWFADKVQRLAFMAPPGLPLRVLSSLIADLNSLLPISQWRFGKAHALCMSAIRE
ncbi:MAG: hypothetical protein IH626_04440 [Rhodospirillales bacterium]|nr:hypothetical protein [Rhodospirillales bacterium]